MTTDQIKIIIVDDHPVVLEGFSFMLQQMPDIFLKAKFADAESAIAYIEEEVVDIVLLDINLPDKNGIDACLIIKKNHPTLHIIAISNINEYSIIQRMLDAGASGYLLKNASAEELATCIEQVLKGQPGLSRDIRCILEQHDRGEIPVITRREKEVLTLLVAGRNSVEIGEIMFISPLTVESHRRNLLQKFQVSNVASLVHKAMEMKFI